MMQKKNILVITYWSYKDALIQTYTLPYLQIIKNNLPKGSNLTLITAEQKHLSISRAETEKIKNELANQNITWIPFQFSKFGMIAILERSLHLLKLLFTLKAKNIAYIHAWCTPAGVTGYILSKLTGIPLIIDSYEPHAEAMVENETWSQNSFSFKLLFWFEKKMSHHASYLIAASKGMKKYAAEKYNLKNKRIDVKPACVNEDIFSVTHIKQNKKTEEELHFSDKITCVYAGKFGGIYLEKEVFDFFKVACDFWKDKFHILLLTPTPKQKIMALANRSNVNTKIITCKFVPHGNIPKYLALADFAINPVKPVPTKKYCTSIKDGEYWSMGLPVVIPSDISDDSEIIEENEIGAVLSGLNDQEYLTAIKKIDKLIHAENIQSIKEKISLISRQYRSMNIAEEIYKSIYQS